MPHDMRDDVDKRVDRGDAIDPQAVASLARQYEPHLSFAHAVINPRSLKSTQTLPLLFSASLARRSRVAAQEFVQWPGIHFRSNNQGGPRKPTLNVLCGNINIAELLVTAVMSAFHSCPLVRIGRRL